ncbi:MAG TPA: transaldolase [Kosmotogaceae bacterium]|nr:MAG: Transaldolase [Thermotogales bacterium 46_20]HAA85003.1 transaldolase [Kosmotogaceae bacterium]
MKLYIDDGNITKITELFKLGVFSGITTNPTIIRRSGRNPVKLIKELLSKFPGDLFVQCVSTDIESIIKEGTNLFELDPERIKLKVTFSEFGMKALAEFNRLKIPVTMTGLFSVPQVLMCCEGGADYAAPYVSRMENLGINLSEVEKMQRVIINGSYSTKLIVASFKTMTQISRMAELPIHSMTLSASMCDGIFEHCGTLKAIEGFDADWEAIKHEGWVTD